MATVLFNHANKPDYVRLRRFLVHSGSDLVQKATKQTPFQHKKDDRRYHHPACQFYVVRVLINFSRFFNNMLTDLISILN